MNNPMKSVILSHLVLTASLLAKTETPEAGRQDLIPGDRVTCGIQCLYCLCRINGIKADINELYRMMPQKDQGTSMLDLAKAGESLGLECEGYKADFEGLENLALPVIAHLTKLHYVVISSISSDGVTIASPPSRIINMSRDEFGEEWSGYVLACRKRAKDTAISETKAYNCAYLDEPVWDLGECPSGRTYKHTFELVNGGPDVLTIESVKSSCGCVVAEIEKRRLSKNEKARIDVKLHSAGRTGTYMGRILVSTSSKEASLLEAKIQAKFMLYQGALTTFPREVVWEGIQLGHGASRKIKIARFGEDPLRFQSAECDLPFVSISTPASQKGIDGNYIELVATLDKDVPAGSFRGLVRVKTLHSKYATIDIPVSGRIANDIVATPRTVFINHVTDDSTMNKEIVIKSGAGNDFEIERITTEPPTFPGKIVYEKTGKAAWKVVLVSENTFDEEIFQGNILVNTNTSQTPRLDIPVTLIRTR